MNQSSPLNIRFPAALLGEVDSLLGEGETRSQWIRRAVRRAAKAERRLTPPDGTDPLVQALADEEAAHVRSGDLRAAADTRMRRKAVESLDADGKLGVSRLALPIRPQAREELKPTPTLSDEEIDAEILRRADAIRARRECGSEGGNGSGL